MKSLSFSSAPFLLQQVSSPPSCYLVVRQATCSLTNRIPAIGDWLPCLPGEEKDCARTVITLLKSELTSSKAPTTISRMAPSVSSLATHGPTYPGLVPMYVESISLNLPRYPQVELVLSYLPPCLCLRPIPLGIY